MKAIEMQRSHTIERFIWSGCVEHAISAFSPQLLSLPNGVEIRYAQPGDVYTMPDEPKVKRSYSLDKDVIQELSKLKHAGIMSIGKRLEEFDKEGIRAKLNFGSAIIVRARELGLAKTLIHQAETRSALPPNISLEKEMGSYDILRFGGLWGIATDDNSKPTLLLLTSITPIRSGEKLRRSYEAVNLDDLHKLDPKFLSQQIRDFEVKQAMGALANSITTEVATELRFHKISGAELLPRYMRRLSGIANLERRTKEMQSISAFLSLMVKLGYDHYKDVYNFQQELYNRKSDAGSGGSVWIEHYLGHMAKCSLRSEAVQEINTELLSFYSNITDIVFKEQQAENPELLGILQKITASHSLCSETATQIGITDKEQTHLMELTKGKDWGGGLPSVVDSNLYAGLLIALYLEKQGKVDMHSLVFRELLKSLFPGRPETVWEKL